MERAKTRKNKPRRKPGLGVSKNGKNCIDGKEESYERNPGGVPFVFNPKFSERFNVLKTRVSKNGKNSNNGKEESYERNPGGVPFVFNPEFSELF